MKIANSGKRDIIKEIMDDWEKRGFTLIKNLCELFLYLLGLSLELILRLIRFLIPLGLYNYLLQMKTKPTPTTAIGAYLTPKSTFMFIAPGIILVSVEGDQYKKFFEKTKRVWNKNFPKFFVTLQCIAYICITLYFVCQLLKFW